MSIVISILTVLASIVLIVSVLMQEGDSDGISALAGGSNSDTFFGGEAGQKVSGGFGEESFAGSWRARDENVVVPCNGDLDGAFGEFLTPDMVQQNGVFVRIWRFGRGLYF